MKQVGPSLVLAALLLAAPGCRRHHPEANLPTDPSIAYGLGDGNPERRKEAANTLRDEPQPPPDAAPALIRAIGRETDPDVKSIMLIALGATGAPEARQVLETYANDPDKDVRKGASRGLERFGKRTGQSMEAVGKIARLQNADWKVRREAAEDLDSRGGPPPEAVPALLAAVGRENNPKALEPELIALGATGVPEARPILESRFDDPNDDVRRAAHKGMKRWLSKNGQNVRRDVATGPAPMPGTTGTAGTTGTQGTTMTLTSPPGSTGSPAQATPETDGCGQFKDICAADPFNVDKCRTDMKALNVHQQQVWADCVNESQAACQKAHDGCIAKAKAAK